ncbi:RNA-binding S4 domain-containing protein [Deinococcus detaillensis]|uniref:RNA-binding S4 domain-containing protein n=2 Tax=Deinococcus detaillensis TaxID=2592048 RepID=A0A553ULR4_9DEIO|nr:RNA-binding S4 domain-containing protein [Deinococcus detaillensis]
MSQKPTSKNMPPKTETADLPETIDLQDFLKLEGLVDTGGEAKFRVQSGEVKLNGLTETRRRKKLHRGDVVEIHGASHTVDW